LNERVEAFRKAIDSGTPTEPLVLTSEDINALIEENDNLKGKVYVTIEGDKIKGQVSIPLTDFVDFGMTRGRYLNGEADLKASLKDGVLLVTLESFEVNGKRPPADALANLRQQNLAQDAYKNPKNAEQIRKLESLEIKDGKLIIRARAQKAGTQPGAPKTLPELPDDTFGPSGPNRPAAEPPKTEPSKTEPHRDEALPRKPE
jgi:hypothetical protein